MKKTHWLVVLLLVCVQINAQNGLAKKSDIKKFKSRPILVVLETENSEYSKFFNKTIKEIFKKYWTLNDSVMFMEKGIYKTKRRGGQRGWAVVEFSEDAFYKSELEGWSSSSYDYRYRIWHWQACAMMFSLVEDHDKIYNFIHRETLPNMFPSKGDLIYSLQMTQNLFKNKLNNISRKDNKKQIQLNSKFLKNKTLLIDSSELHKNLTIEKLKKAYPYPMELVGYDQIQKAIVNNDSSYAYIQIVPTTYPLFESSTTNEFIVTSYGFGHRIVGAKNGTVLGELKSVNLPIRIMTYGGRIKAKQLKKFTKSIEK
ncbi:MAG: hypothetical protein ACJA0Q_000682 [Saprospiraceae bacterium]|jgi:hypothetical protein